MKQAKLWVTILLLFSFLLPTFFHADAARIAVIKEVKGEVYIKKGGGKREFKAKDGMSLSQGDSVRTKGKSTANITYDDGTKTTVGTNSKLTISKLNNKNNGNQTKVKLLSGKVWNSVENLTNVNDEYDIETPTTIMGVRGTHFLVSTDPITGKSSVTVLEGVVGVSQNSDTTNHSNSETSSDNLDEQLVSINQMLDTNTNQAPVPEARPLDVKQLIEQVEPEVIVEIIQDLTQAVKEMNEQAITTQKEFEQTKQQELITKALELSKTASAIATIQEHVLVEINNSTIKPEVEKILETKFNQTFENVLSESKELKTETKSTEQQVTNAAIDSGLTQTQLDSIGPTSPLTSNLSANPASLQSENNGGGGGGSSEGNEDSDNDETTPTNPIGTPITIEDGKPIIFTGGVSLDLTTISLPEGTTVTATELNVTELAPTLVTKGLKPVGKVIDFTFNGGTVNQPVELSLPIQQGADKGKIGIFYLKQDGNWEYQPSIVENEAVTAIVTHFSTYGVLEAEKAPQPKAMIAGELIEGNSTIIVDVGTEISLFTDSTDAAIFYSIEGLGTKQLYQPTNKPKIENEKMVLRAYSAMDNRLHSSKSIFTFIARPSAPIVTADDVQGLLIGADDTMEYSVDNGLSWVSYISAESPIFQDSQTVLVRVKANGEIPASKETTVSFTKDEIPPVITLLGDNPLTLSVGDTYTEPGATAVDDVDGEITEITIDSSSVNTSVAGSYTVTYKATDHAGNIGTETRTVIIVEPILPDPYNSYINGLNSISFVDTEFTFDIEVRDSDYGNIANLPDSIFTIHAFSVTAGTELLGTFEIISIDETLDEDDRLVYRVTARHNYPEMININVKIAGVEIGSIEAPIVEKATVEGSIILPNSDIAPTEGLEVTVTALESYGFGFYPVNQERITIPAGYSSVNYSLSIPANTEVLIGYELESYEGFRYVKKFVEEDINNVVLLPANEVGTFDLSIQKNQELQNVTTVNGNDHVTINWNSDPSIESYSIYVDGNDDSMEIYDQSINSYTITNLSPNTTYTIWLVGQSGNSDFPTYAVKELPITTTETPVMPSLQVNRGSTSIALSWDPVPSATEYQLSINGGTPELLTEPNYQLTGLDPNTIYTVQISAMNGATTIASSLKILNTLSALNILEPFYNSGLQDDGIYETAINLEMAYKEYSWQSIYDYKYKIRYGLNGQLTNEVIYAPSGGSIDFTTYMIENLEPNTDYTIAVTAYHETDTDFSEPEAESIITVKTEEIVPPAFEAYYSKMNGNNTEMKVYFSEAMYTNNDGTGGLTPSDFMISFNQNGGTATSASIIDIVGPYSDTHPTGGEDTVRFKVAIEGTPSGDETISISPKMDEVFDKAGTAMPIMEALTLTLNVGPSIDSAAVAADNSYVDVIFNEELRTNQGSDGYYASDPVTANDFTLLFNQNGGTATDVTISSITKHDGDPVDQWTNMIRFHLVITGTPNGSETIEIKPKSGEIFNASSALMADTETTGIIALNTPDDGNLEAIADIQIDNDWGGIEPNRVSLKWTGNTNYQYKISYGTKTIDFKATYATPGQYLNTFVEGLQPGENYSITITEYENGTPIKSGTITNIGTPYDITVIDTDWGINSSSQDEFITSGDTVHITFSEPLDPTKDPTTAITEAFADGFGMVSEFFEVSNPLHDNQNYVILYKGNEQVYLNGVDGRLITIASGNVFNLSGDSNTEPIRFALIDSPNYIITN